MSVIEAPEAQTAEPLVEPDPVLMRAAEIVRERWCQDAFGKEGGSRCAAGAIYEACGWDGRMETYQDYWGVRDRVTESLGVVALEIWNDTPGRTADEVAEALERAAVGL